MKLRVRRRAYGFRQQFLVQLPGVVQWQRGHLVTVAEHFCLEPAQFDHFGRGQGAGEFPVDEVAAPGVLLFGPRAVVPVTFEHDGDRQHADDGLAVQFQNGTLRIGRQGENEPLDGFALSIQGDVIHG